MHSQPADRVAGAPDRMRGDPDNMFWGPPNLQFKHWSWPPPGLLLTKVSDLFHIPNSRHDRFRNSCGELNV